MTRWLASWDDDEVVPWCQAHPRPDQTLPADDARRDVAWIAWSIAFLLLIVLLSSLVPDWTTLRPVVPA